MGSKTDSDACDTVRQMVPMEEMSRISKKNHVYEKIEKSKKDPKKCGRP
jgi:hypothetical protein